MCWDEEGFDASASKEWKREWNNETLRTCLAERPNFCKEYLGRDGSIEEVLRSFSLTVIDDLDEFKFDRESNGEIFAAFWVRDFGGDWLKHVSSSHPCDRLEKGGDLNFLNRIKEARSYKYSRGREIEVFEFTPSAVTAILMCSPTENSDDPHAPNAFHAMLKHLSAEGFFDYSELSHCRKCFCMVLPFCIIEESGIPSSSMNSRKSIRMQKFSISVERFGSAPLSSSPLSWLLAIYGAPARRRLQYDGDQTRMCEWIAICLMSIRDSWINVLEEVDRQISVKGIIKVLPECENHIIFYDEHPYRWALQVLTIFLDMIDRTANVIKKHLESIPI